jgi:WD40 repeat protein
MVVRTVPDGRLLARMRLPNDGALTSAALSPDASLLVTGSDDGTAQVWRVATGEPALPPLVGHLSGIGKVGFSEDGRTILSYSDDGTARMWNVATGQEMVSGLPLNDLLKDHVWSGLLIGDGNGLVEAVDADRIRIVRLPTLREIDAVEQNQDKPR